MRRVEYSKKYLISHSVWRGLDLGGISTGMRKTGLGLCRKTFPPHIGKMLEGWRPLKYMTTI